MIDDVDAALRSLLSPVTKGKGPTLSFEAPTKDWAARRTAPTLDVYLFDIKEDLDLRRVAREPVRTGTSEDRRTTSHRVPPRFYRLDYLLTAWTNTPEDEHRVLSAALRILVLVDVVPAEHLTGALADQPYAVRLDVAQPMSEERSLADLWTALGGELKPSLELVVTAPVDVSRETPVEADAVRYDTVADGRPVEPALPVVERPRPRRAPTP